MRFFRLLASISLISAFVVFAAGCNREKLPKLGTVTGRVTMDGQPVPEATVIFESTKEGESPSLGKTDADGRYELYYSRGHKGATPGEHVVRISTYNVPGDDGGQVQKETIPSRYNVKSELKTEVKRGRNVDVNFELKSGGEVLQPGEEPAKKGKYGSKGR
jgi:hypothetical protein